MCFFTLKSIIDNYLASSSSIYVCYVDASIAFNRLNYWILFDKLLKRSMPTMYLRFLMNWYCSQQYAVRWGNHISKYFHVSNRVRQGGVLSPVLFNRYRDDLSCLLNQAKAGCVLNEINFNHILYADDTVSLSPSIRG